MMKLKIFLSFLVIMLISFTGIATAQEIVSPSSRCGSRASIVYALAGKWQETQIFLGLISSETALEIFLNEETHTWTAITSQIDGLSCVFFSGIGTKKFENMDLSKLEK